ncbi:hypothetical protein [Actinomadura rubrisoli]|uniref:hypothetical protein n=1 Tax=Actinomadura rubrisoli TaxID=2530368 RepID=UPI001FB7E4C9|nr:hypothetical protein [Actinomadura rubrisoli]
MAWPEGGDVYEADLNLGAKLGQGGQGQVFRLEAPHQGYVYKKYIVPGADAAALQDLLDLPGTLKPTDRTSLYEQTCWPLARVISNGTLSGFVMREISGRFFGETVAGARLRELQYLLYDPKPAWGKITPLDVDRRVGFARELTFLVRLLHGQDLVLGDISMNNVLWSDEPRPAVVLLDCDGVRRLGSRPVLRQAETPDWDDPHMPATGPDLETDRYKLALAIGRLLSGRADLRPGKPLSLLPGLSQRVSGNVAVAWTEAAGSYGSRPDAQQWLMALSDREEVALPTPPPVRTRPSLPRTELESGDAGRGVVRFAGPAPEP